MKVIEKRTEDLKPYENNPRNNKAAVEYVAESIKDFGFKVPIVIDKDNVIVCGHTRLLAAKKLKLKTVPCVVVTDLTEDQIKAYRLADNKVQEFSGWDFEKVQSELAGIANIDMSKFLFVQEEPKPEKKETKKHDEIVKCPKCGHEFTV